MLEARAADHEAGAPRGVAAVEQRVDRRGCGHARERRVGAVDGLRPRRDGPAGRGLEHVRREARVGQRQVERSSASVALEIDVGQLPGREPVQRSIGDRLLDERLVAQPGIRPRRGDDLVLEAVCAFAVLLDGQQRPAAVALGERPILGESGPR